ncbi:unnamed protein product, partial [Musa acuminata subsp. burmannicoides]
MLDLVFATLGQRFRHRRTSPAGTTTMRFARPQGQQQIAAHPAAVEPATSASRGPGFCGSLMISVRRRVSGKVAAGRAGVAGEGRRGVRTDFCAIFPLPPIVVIRRFERRKQAISYNKRLTWRSGVLMAGWHHAQGFRFRRPRFPPPAISGNGEREEGKSKREANARKF